MEFWEVILTRRSVRQFRQDKPLKEAQVEKLLEAAIRAPSAGNRQPWHFYVVWSQDVKDGLAEAAFGQGFIAEAPVVIVVCADASRSAARYGSRGRDLYCIQDTAIAATHIMLAAVDMGLGTCWVGAFDEEQAAAVLRLPAVLRPVAILPIGYPAKEGGPRTPRRGMSEVVTTLK
ncbi:MAG: nitroreductase family protein [Chloroflexi bacterium]|nr:nitroreductase family protein [Chloroflexota bacterium]